MLGPLCAMEHMTRELWISPCPQSSDRIHTIDQSSWQRRLIERGPSRPDSGRLGPSFFQSSLEMRESGPGDAGKVGDIGDQVHYVHLPRTANGCA